MKGVTYKPARYISTIGIRNKRIYLGSFETYEEACECRIQANEKHKNEINFIKNRDAEVYKWYVEGEEIKEIAVGFNICYERARQIIRKEKAK